MTENTKYINYLFEQARKGSKGSYYRLLEMNLGKLFPIAIRLTANEEMANQVVKHVIIFSMKNIQQARMDSAFSSWLKAITVRECINLHYNSESAQSAGEGEDHIFNKDLLSEFDLALLKLPREPRYIIVLYDILKYSMTEVSDMLSIGDPDNVRVMIKLSRKRILEELR